MTIDQLSAQDIAEHQLVAAIEMWKSEDFICAITLAGAAEEILGKQLRSIGIEPAFENTRKAVLEIAQRTGEVDPSLGRQIGQLLNQTRNELKHYSGNEVLEFDLKRDAEEILDRAISNYETLTGQVLPEMLKFRGSTNEA